MTKSGVIGLSPTVPRTPSVPKYLRIVGGFPDRDHVARLFHIVDSQYSRPALQSEQSHGQAAGEALADRPAGDLLQARLAREAREHGERGQLLQTTQQFEVVRDRLAEPEPRVDDDPLGRDTRVLCRLNALFQK